MRFVEIQSGLSICVDEIVAIQRMEDQFKCKVYTETRDFEANFPYITLLSILERQKEDKGNDRVLREISEKVGNLPVFAG